MHIMTKVLVVCSIALFFATANCWAFRCGSGIVSSGDTKTQVLVTCGKPTSKEKLSKKVHIWHYNCGNGDFIYALTFENNILKNETTEGRGKGKSKCRGK